MRLPLPDVDRIRKKLLDSGLQGHVQVFSEIDSTNRIARDRALAGGPDGTLVIADAQRWGRGRESREWFSPPGLGLWMSTLRRDGLPAARGAFLPIAAGIAAAEAIERAHPVSIELEWPNDLVVAGRKLGGILVESSTSGDVLAWAVIGIGINLVASERDFPPAIRTRAISLAMLGVREVDRDALAAEIHVAVTSWTERLAREGPEPVIEAFGRRDALEGHRVRVEGCAGPLVGTARGMDPDGALIVEVDDGPVAIRAGGATRL